MSETDTFISYVKDELAHGDKGGKARSMPYKKGPSGEGFFRFVRKIGWLAVLLFFQINVLELSYRLVIEHPSKVLCSHYFTSWAN